MKRLIIAASLAYLLHRPQSHRPRKIPRHAHDCARKSADSLRTL